jgi:hypothetical protein
VNFTLFRKEHVTLPLMKLIFFLLLPFVIIQCGSSSNPSTPSTPSTLATRKYVDKEDAQKAFESSTVNCSTEDCPGFVGGLYAYTSDFMSYEISSCSATLISKNRILTNRHCIPDDLKFKGARCNQRIKIYFPKTQDYQEKRHECDQIEYITSYDSTMAPDWAVIRFKEASDRPAAKLNRDGIEDNTLVTIYKINFDLSLDKASRGEVNKSNCIANSNYVYSINSIGPQSALMSVSDCNNEIIRGNSGTGILNEKNELIGVLSFNFNVNPEESSIARSNMGIKQTSGGGSNLACMEFDSFKAPRLCEFNPKNYQLYAEILSLYRAQRNDESFNITNTLVANPENQQWLEMTNEITSEKIGNFNVKDLSGTDDLKLYMTHYILQTHFFEIPKCIKNNAPPKFKFKMLIRESEGKIKTNPQFYKSIPSKLKEIEVDVEKQASGENILNFPNILEDELVAELLGLAHFNFLDYKIPNCQ